MTSGYKQYQDISFFMQQQGTAMLPINNEKIVRKNNKNFYQSNSQKQINADKLSSQQYRSRCLNILSLNKVSSKYQISQEFIQLLTIDNTNSQISIISLMGSKNIGKSFLIDCLISLQQKQINREMTKNSKPIINIPTKYLNGRNSQKILLFDHHSSNNNNNQIFMWLYFLSSVIVFNFNTVNRNDQEQFIRNLSYLKSHLDSTQEQLTLPKLIILRRDCENSSINNQIDKQFTKRIQDYNLFQNDILTININYPGTTQIKVKQIINVPQSMLNKQYLNDIINLHNLLKTTSKPKLIRGNLIGTKILSLLLDPLTKSINKQKKLNTIKIWDDVIETLSVGYYNYYILKYSQELQKQFQDQKPYDKYTLYKKLSGIKRKIEKKVEGFNTISDDPIFQKYREKLNQKIQSKQKMIKQINKQKSKKYNDQYCKMIFKDMNQNNCEKLIQQYNKSNLDQGKTQVLLQNFQTIINQRINQIQKSKVNKSKSKNTQIESLQQQLKRIQQQISQQSNLKIPVVDYDPKPLQQSIKIKQKQIQKLTLQLKQQKQISSKKKVNQNKDILALQKNIQELKQKTQQQQKQIQMLRNDRQKKIQQMTKDLQENLKKQEDKLAKLEQELKKKKVSPLMMKTAETGSKNKGCCVIM